MSEEQQAFAKELLENLISFFGLNVEVEVTTDGDYTVLHVPSSELNGFLIGTGWRYITITSATCIDGL
jgi:predicted RNA-binding protein Jag